MKAAWWIATVGGIGRVPIAPGTAGSAAGLALAWLLYSAWGAWAVMMVILPLTALGVAASSALTAGGGDKDPSIIVIDEVCGMLVAVAGLSFTGLTALGAFVLFRLFDIVKPFPLSWIERRLPGGWGVMGDDLAAGLAANLCVRAVSVWWGDGS
ncbi:MAG: phosphatidylglycerophosphatase A [Nitrospirota bacterium]